MLNNTHKLIIGTVQFGLDYGINNRAGKPGRDEIEEILKRAFQAGIDCLDTAEAYGNAHQIIGDFHRKYSDTKFQVISKIPQKFTGSLTSKIQSYLDELFLDKLEGILFHSYDAYRNDRYIVDELNVFKENGKINKIGVSIYTSAQMENVIDDDLIDIIQLPFNLLDNSNLRGEVLLKAKDKGKIIHTRSAFLQGLFFVDPRGDNQNVRALESELASLKKIAAENRISMHQLALGYCLHQQMIDNVLIGVDNLNQLNQNIADAQEILPNSVIDAINEIIVENINLLNPSLWR